MSVHKSGIDHPMSAVENVEVAQGWAARLENRERARTGWPLKAIRPLVAKKVGVSPGTLENLRHGRTKDPRKSIFDKLRAALIRELEAEMRAHEHEIHILKQTGADPRSDEITAAEKGLAEIREALGK